jgi:hypothetical protein
MKLDYVNDQIVEAKHNVNFYEKDNVKWNFLTRLYHCSIY